MAKRLTAEQVKLLAMEFQFPLNKDFHALSSMEVLGIIDAANEWRYRAPKNANGSRARYFYSYMRRVLDKG